MENPVTDYETRGSWRSVLKAGSFSQVNGFYFKKVEDISISMKETCLDRWMRYKEFDFKKNKTMKYASFNRKRKIFKVP